MDYVFSVHTHTDYVDGSSSADDMVKRALEVGMSAVGFTEHAVQHHDARYGLTDEDEIKYISQIKRLQKEYEGRLLIRLGIERDALSYADRSKYEYVIGSVHYITSENGRTVAVDGDPADLHKMVEDEFAGDGVGMAALYYKTLADYIEEYKPDIIGHFDVVTKHNEDGTLIDVSSPRYVKYAGDALERCVKACPVLEINTGAVSRGYRKEVYPDLRLLNIWRELGGNITIGTDSHHVSTIDAYFDDAVRHAQKAGFKSLKALGAAPELFFDIEI